MGLFGGNKDNGYRPTRSTPITKVHPSGRRVVREKIKIVYEPPPKNTRERMQRDRRDARYARQEARADRRQDRKGGWGLFSN